MWSLNPRIAEIKSEDNKLYLNSINDEKTLINTILNKDIEKFKNLAIDISENGLISANNILISPNEDNSYTVIEGNRRIACIKCIKNPKLIYDKNIQEIFNNLYYTNSSIPCYIDTYENNIKILEKIHMGKNIGKGRIDWESENKDIYYLISTNLNNNIDLTSILLDTNSNYKFKLSFKFKLLFKIIYNHIGLNDKYLNILESIPITTLERLLNFSSNIINISSITNEYINNKINKENIIYISELIKYISINKHNSRTLNKIEDFNNVLKLFNEYYNLNKSDLQKSIETNIVTIKSNENYQNINNINGSTSIRNDKSSNNTNNINKNMENKKHSKQISLFNNIEITQDKPISCNNSNITEIKNPTSRNFFECIKFSALNKEDNFENGIIVLCEELKNLSKKTNKVFNYANFPISTCMLMRSLLENVLIYYGKKSPNTKVYNYISSNSSEHIKLSKLIKYYNNDIKSNEKNNIFSSKPNALKAFKSVQNITTHFNTITHTPYIATPTKELIDTFVNNGFYTLIDELLN